MEFNSTKTHDISLPAKGSELAAPNLDYLGYYFSTYQRKRKDLSRVVRVSISPKKLSKLRTRIYRSVQIFQRDYSMNMLIERLRFLSSNYNVPRTSVSFVKDNTHVLSGIYYNYRLCGSYSADAGHVEQEDYDCVELKEIDGFYNSCILRLARFPLYQINASDLARLRRISFFKGYTLRIKVRLQPDKIILLKRPWRDA